MTASAKTFGAYLRRERERSNVSLDDIARSTKIGKALLVSLESGDVSAWPAGIFRRAFFRNYAKAIGLDPEPLMSEFSSLFPDAPPAAQPARPPTDEVEVDDTPPPNGLRLTLAREPRPHVSGRNVAGAIVDVVAVAVLVAGTATAGGAFSGIWAAFAVAAVYYAVPAAMGWRTPGRLLFVSGPTRSRIKEPAALRLHVAVPAQVDRTEKEDRRLALVRLTTRTERESRSRSRVAG